jgi:hypothetical protein
LLLPGWLMAVFFAASRLVDEGFGVPASFL